MNISIIGLIIVFLIMLPNIFFGLLLSPRNMPTSIPKNGLIFNILERIGQALSLISLIFFISDKQLNIWFFMGIIFILFYYLLWLRYIINNRDYTYLFKAFYFIPIPLAVLPILSFTAIAIWNQSIVLAISTIIFSIGHIKNSLNNNKFV